MTKESVDRIEAPVEPALRLRGHARETCTFEEFCDVVAPALALDGYVRGPSRWSLVGPHWSFNHHEDVNRLAYRATCEQVSVALDCGLGEMLVDRHDSHLDVHVNDADEDVCLSYWLLAHPAAVGRAAVRRLVAVEGLLDTTGGCFAPRWANEELLAELAWVFAPYRAARDSGIVGNEGELAAIVEDVGGRITAHVEGCGGRVAAWGGVEILAERGGAVAVVERGPYGRMAACRTRKPVLVVLRQAEAHRTMSLVKTSPFVAVDLEAAYERLNSLEGCAPEDGWGGSDLVGGSPRSAGSALPLEVVLEVVAGCVG